MKSNTLKNRNIKITTIRLKMILLAIILFFSILPGKTLANDQSELSTLWIDLSMGPPLLDLFNQTAKSGDIARVEHISQLGLLQDVTAGQKLVVFKSADDAIRLLPHIHDEFDIVGYNLEHGPANPISEQEDPVGSIIKSWFRPNGMKISHC